MTLSNDPPTLEKLSQIHQKDYSRYYKKPFQKFVELCLSKDPAKRPTAAELLKTEFMKVKVLSVPNSKKVLCGRLIATLNFCAVLFSSLPATLFFCGVTWS